MMKRLLTKCLPFVLSATGLQAEESTPGPVNTWAAYQVYAADNEKVDAPVDVVFMGDSITEGWSYYRPEFFSKNKFLGRGIGGQTTYQMLARFQSDVVKLAPQCVVILAGTNDLAQNLGFIDNKQIAENIKSMCEIAKFNGIKPIICSVLPVYEYAWNKGLGVVAPTVKDLNSQLQIYATANDIFYVDFHAAMRDHRDGLPANLSKDGVHVLEAGYAIMEEMILPIVEKNLK